MRSAFLASNGGSHIHTTAKVQRGLTPELEDWVFSAVVTACVAIPFWFLVLFFYKAPQIMKSELEQDSERLVKQIKLDRLIMDNKRRAKELEQHSHKELQSHYEDEGY